jgi:hypothetical protein
MRRFIPAIVMNILVPGTGLMLLGKAWLGLALAVAFGATAEVAACGLLLAPASIPEAINAPAVVLAGTAWLAAQLLLIARIRSLGQPAVTHNRRSESVSEKVFQSRDCSAVSSPPSGKGPQTASSRARL